jgi:biotin operon repressor
VFLSLYYNFIVEVKCYTIIKLAIMNKFQRETLKRRLIKLASLKGTGAPEKLAEKFEISERSVKRMVKEIRDEGTEIWFCQIRQSYVLEEKNTKHVV